MKFISTFQAYSWSERLVFLTRILVILAVVAIPVSTSATSILFLLIFLLSLFAGNWRQKISAILKNPAILFFAILFGFYFIGVFYSASPFLMAFKYFLKYLPFLFVLFLIPFFQEERWRRYVIDAFLLVMSVIVVLSYAKIVMHWHFGSRLGQGEVATVFKDHIYHSFLLAIAIFFTCYRIFYLKNTKLMNVFYWAFIALSVVNLLLFCASRTGYIIFFALLGYFFFEKFRWKGLLLAIIVACLMLGLAWQSSIFQSRVKSVWTALVTYESSTVHRTNTDGIRLTWDINSVRLIKRRPFFGYGTSSTETVYRQLPKEVRYYHTISLGAIANEYLNVSVQLGLVGMLVLLLMLGLHWYKSNSLLRSEKFYSCILLVAIIVSNLFNASLTDTVSLHLYTLLTPVLFSGGL